MDTKTLFSSKTSDWETPDWLFDELNEEFNFVWDAAANRDNAKLANHLNIANDSLATPWHEVPLAYQGAWWLNPPYGRRMGQWTKKALDESQHGLTVVVLVPSRTDTGWWHNHAMMASEIRLIRGRLRFKGAGSAAPFPSAILVFRPASVVVEPVKFSVIDARGR